MSKRIAIFVFLARMAVLAVIILATYFLIWRSQSSSGVASETSRYMILSGWIVGRIAIPVLIVVDLLVHTIIAFINVQHGRARNAIIMMVQTILADAVIAAASVVALLRLLAEV